MDFEEMQAKWQTLESRCDRVIVGLEKERHEKIVWRASWASILYACWPVVDLVFGLAVSVFAGGFAASHWPIAVSVWPAVCAAVAGNALIGASVYKLVLLGRIDWDDSVVETQRRLMRMKAFSVRQFKWILLLAPLAGFAFLMVAFEALTAQTMWGQFDRAWIIANIAFGILWIPLGWCIARTCVDRLRTRGWFQRAIDAISGRSLARIEGQVHRLEDFMSIE